MCCAYAGMPLFVVASVSESNEQGDVSVHYSHIKCKVRCFSVLMSLLCASMQMAVLMPSKASVLLVLADFMVVTSTQCM